MTMQARTAEPHRDLRFSLTLCECGGAFWVARWQGRTAGAGAGAYVSSGLFISVSLQSEAVIMDWMGAISVPNATTTPFPCRSRVPRPTCRGGTSTQPRRCVASHVARSADTTIFCFISAISKFGRLIFRKNFVIDAQIQMRLLR